MKNYVIGLLTVIILFLSSLLYKHSITTVERKFPIYGEVEKVDVEIPFFLNIFFSKQNCSDCLEIISVLNNLPPHFIVQGIVPDNELKDEGGLRRMTEAEFPLSGTSNYNAYIPWYSPAIVGVSSKGDIIFTLPGVPGEKEYLKVFLESLYKKLYPVLLEEKFSEKLQRKGGHTK